MKTNKHMYIFRYVPVEDRQSMHMISLDLLFKEEKDLCPVDRSYQAIIADYYCRYKDAAKHCLAYTDYGLTKEEFGGLTPFEAIKLLNGKIFKFEGALWMCCVAENPFEVVDIYKKGMMERD